MTSKEDIETVEKIIEDSEVLSEVTEEIEDEEELLNIVYNFPNIKGIENIVKLYQGYYDFTKSKLLILVKDLDFIISKRVDSILIFLKFLNTDSNLFDGYLKNEYDNIILQDSIFLTLIYYDINEDLYYYFNKNEIDKALKISVEIDNLKLFIFLLNNGYIRNDNILLELIVRQKGTDILKYLFEHKFDIRIKDDYALRLGSKKGNLKVVKFLIEKGANIHEKDDFALRFASKNGHLEIVKILIENDTNIHANDDNALKRGSKN